MCVTALGRRYRSVTLLAGLTLSLAAASVNAQTAGVIYTWPTNTSDWVRNFGAASTSATLSNSGNALQIVETSTALGGAQAFSDGFNTARDVAPYASGNAGGLDLYGLTSLEFDLGHNGASPVNVQFFTQASAGSTYVALGPDVAVLPGTNTYSLPLAGLTYDQISYMRTIGISVRDHNAQGNLTWTLNEIRSVGAGATSRVIADHNGGAADFDGVITNFDAAAVVGGNGGQNNSGLSIVGGTLQWTDAGGGPGAAITWGNGTQTAGGSFGARPVDLSNYQFVTIRMSATGPDPSVFVQYYMQTTGGFNYQSVDFGNLPADGQFHDITLPLSSIINRNFVVTNGINLGTHANNMVINVDSVIYSVPEPASAGVLAVAGLLAASRRTRRA